MGKGIAFLVIKKQARTFGLVSKKYFQNLVVVDIVTVTGISYFPGDVL